MSDEVKIYYGAGICPDGYVTYEEHMRNLIPNSDEDLPGLSDAKRMMGELRRESYQISTAHDSDAPPKPSDPPRAGCLDQVFSKPSTTSVTEESGLHEL